MLLLSACGGATPHPADPQNWTPTEIDGCIRRVLIISLDGLRPDALSSLRTPNMMRLAARGASTTHAQTTTPSTLPAHASMLSGYDPFGHGVIWNDHIPLFGFIRSSTVFSIAHAHGLRTVMLVAKEKLVHIAAPGTVDEFHFIPGGDDEITEAGIETIDEGFGVLFIHLRALDSTGHRYGWMGAEYLAATNRTDRRVGDLLTALKEAGLEGSTLVILTSDHGGSETGHGSRSEEDMTIPWIVSGPGVKEGIELADGITTVDTAATALWAFGLPVPGDLDGQPIVEMYTARAIEACGLDPVR
jgi:arylsulfatase A-like enzyme